MRRFSKSDQQRQNFMTRESVQKRGILRYMRVNWWYGGDGIVEDVQWSFQQQKITHSTSSLQPKSYLSQKRQPMIPVYSHFDVVRHDEGTYYTHTVKGQQSWDHF